MRYAASSEEAEAESAKDKRPAEKRGLSRVRYVLLFPVGRCSSQGQKSGLNPIRLGSRFQQRSTDGVNPMLDSGPIDRGALSAPKVNSSAESLSRDIFPSSNPR